ncbi:hypothetical protein TNCV_2743961 [Trichonephila clavipes]|nr:hypothetical protein TNCV_2743961 [Trichonephila clavipes]
MTMSVLHPESNPIEHLWDVLERGLKGHHTSLTHLTELGTALANIWQVILMECFPKVTEYMPRRVVVVIKATEGPTR